MTFADLFCGCGGLSLGLKHGGLRHLWGLDSDQVACSTYEANIGRAIHATVASVDWLSLERPDVVVGSPPCQGFSVAGKRQRNDPRNFLVWGFVWAVAVLRPRAFLMENVPGVGQGDWGQFPSIVRMALETLGYNVSVFKLNAADYGVPQIRRRVFWAGCLDGFIQIPLPTHAQGGMMGLKPWVTVREALGIPLNTQETGFYRHPCDYNRKALYSFDEISPTVRGVNRPCPDLLWDGYNAKALPDAPCPSIRGTGTQHGILDSPSRPVLAGNDKGTNPLRMRTQRMATGKAHTPESDVEGRPSLTLWVEAPIIKGVEIVSPDAPSPSVRAGGVYDHTGKLGGGHPPYLLVDKPPHAIDHTGFSLKAHTKAEQSMGGDRLYRRLTVAECLVLQGFPEGFRVLGSKTQQYRQVGNAVPPPVAKALAHSVLEALGG